MSSLDGKKIATGHDQLKMSKKVRVEHEPLSI